MELSPPWRTSIHDAKPRACSDRSGRAASVALWPAAAPETQPMMGAENQREEKAG
ncbi:TPA: hypothetical protein ACHG4M_003960 [Escherichia coli]